MKQFFIKAFVFWFVLLFVALINATLREATYKPLLVPYIGNWAHQISSLTGIIAFYIAIYWFLKRGKFNISSKDIIIAGSMWVIMTIAFECWMNVFIRKLNFQEVLETYYFWKGESWSFVLLSLIVSPFIAHRKIRGCK